MRIPHFLTPLLLLGCGSGAEFSPTTSATASLERPPSTAHELSPASGRISRQETLIQAALARANTIRRSHGLKELTVDKEITWAAQAHADDMDARSYFQHDSPEGESPFDRMRKAGASFQRAAENIAHGTDSPDEVFQLWLDSPGHKANLLNGRYGRHGIGFRNGYWVHKFAD
jgi:uncharacterized protein YkwD